MKGNNRCPKCGGVLIEDAFEEVTISQDGDVIMDGFPAWVCSEPCGYYKRI